MSMQPLPVTRRPRFTAGKRSGSHSGAARLLTGALIAAAGFACLGHAALAQGADEWSGNFARNPGFEEDFHNSQGEGHVISFKGDWFYNQKDLKPDYWGLAGGWELAGQNARSGQKTLKLAAGGTASQSFPGAVYQEGGSSWGGASTVPIKLDTHADRLPQPWRATVWVRGGGTIRLGGVEAKGVEGAGWEQVTVEVPADKAPKDGGMAVALAGPGEFDDLVVQTKFAASPNLIPNGGFETADANGLPAGWSQQKKFDWIGPTYYVWTDWNHFHDPNRGPVRVDPLIARSGKQSLRFDVYPGDEKFIESEPIVLNQEAPHVIEVGAYVRADRIKMIDIRAVNEDGLNMPSHYPIQPENQGGGTALYGNGTFGWRYIRKYFSAPFDQPVKSIRVRLAARGFNANTLDDSGTRSYANQAGTLWWDDLRVTEPTSIAAELTARGARPVADTAAASQIADADLDLGERLYGQNRLTLSLTNKGAAGPFRARLTTTLPGGKPVTTESAPVNIAANQRGTLTVPYRIDTLAGDFQQQGTMRLELLRGTATATDTTYAFNTWPVIVDVDVARHYNLPEENPVTTSFNLGVAAETLAQVARLEINLRGTDDNKLRGQQVITDLKGAFAQTIASLPKSATESYEFKMPTPAWWTDRTNLILTKLDLSQLKVWPENNPTRDTVVEVRALDAAGKVLFSEVSDGLCRVAQRPELPPIESVKVREDGAVLINGQPRFLTGATHQHLRLNHSGDIIRQLGIQGHRLPGGTEAAEKVWKENRIYSLQAKPNKGEATTVANVDMTAEQRQALLDFIKAGGTQSIISFNTGGWETHIPDTPEARASHSKLNDWIRQVSGRPLTWSSSGAYNAWNINEFPYYDIVQAETEMWGPMDFNTIFLPYMRKLRNSPTTWVYLPQLYDNTPYERYRFETYENIIRGSAGVSMIQGIGDPTFNRGLAGELRYLEGPLYSLEKAPAVTLEPNVSHKITSYNKKTYVLATNCGPIIIGNWKWNTDVKQSGNASHEGDSINRMWQRPGGLRLHGFRGLPMPEMIQAGDKIVQYVWLDPKERPEWSALAVRGDGRFNHVMVVGGNTFDFEKFRQNYGNIFMYSELEHSVWHEINWVFDQPTYERSIKVMGKAWADSMKKSADGYRKTVDDIAYKPGDFKKLAGMPQDAGQWQRIEIPVEQLGLVGKLVDGFAYLSQNGRALWDSTTLERNGKTVRVFSDDNAGLERDKLSKVRINVPGLAAGAKVKALFENRTITAEAGGFTDNFEGVDTYGAENGGVTGDLFGFVKDPNRELARMMPSGYCYSYGPTAVHIYEIDQ